MEDPLVKTKLTDAELDFYIGTLRDIPEIEPAVLEVLHWRKGGSNFMSHLFNLLMKADDENKVKLGQTYPHEFSAWALWFSMPSDDDFFDLCQRMEISYR